MRNCIIAALFIVFIFSCKKDDVEVSKVVINELMAVNSYSAMDQDNQFDDWVELYNNTSSAFDLSGHYLSDSKKNLSKWQFPANTTIEPNSFLIIWADKDTLQSGLHTNFKLSSAGEKIYLVAPNLTIMDDVEYEAQALELSFSRYPNGTGAFKWKEPSWNFKN